MEKETNLSQREQEILSLLATGASNKDIATRLNISPNTVKVHLRNIYSKIKVSSRAEATLHAVKSGLVDTAFPEISPEIETSDPAEASHSKARSPLFIAGALLVILAVIFVLIRTSSLENELSSSPATASAVETTPLRRWRNNPSLPEPRQGMASTIFEGRVYLIGGKTPQGITASVISFSPETQTWSTWADKPGAVSDIQSARIGDQIYVPGGLQVNQQPTDQLEVYDPRADRWETRAPLPVPLSDYALAAFEGQLYLFGGWDGENYRSETYQYDPGTDVWTILTPLASARGGARAVSEGGKIYLLGGTDGEQVFKDSLAYYPQRDLNHEPAWEVLSPLPEGRAEMGTAVLAGTIYVVGGITENNSPTPLAPLQYRPQEGQWRQFDSPPETTGARLALIPLEDFLHVLGGSKASGPSNQHQVYQAIFTRAIPIVLP